MANGLVESAAARTETPSERRFYGVAVGKVIDNMDLLGLGRVQLHFPWFPEVEPWARVAVPMAGLNRGMYFIPQIDDEVLVAFNQGDVRQPYVVGSLWNNLERPPAIAPTDPTTKRLIRTPLGHEIEFNEVTQTITITSSTRQKITIEPEKIKIAAGERAATVTLETRGKVSIEGSQEINLTAPTIVLRGTTVRIEAAETAMVRGGAVCSIEGGIVKIN